MVRNSHGGTHVARLVMVLLLSRAECCKNDANCSFNGRCNEGICECSPQWTGPRCETLTLLPASRSAGFRSPHGPNASRTSSWGGSVLFDEVGGLWHMFAAQMVNDCGINYWEPNSEVVHAVANRPEGPYRFESVVIEPFAHEPNAVLSPAGDWVIYATVRHPPGWQANCSSQEDVDARNGFDGPPPRHTYMVHSKSPYGPWSEPVLVLRANYSVWDNRTVLVDTNLAVAILDSGRAVGIWRKCENTPGTICEFQCCTFPHLLVADDWSDPTTYHPESALRLFDGIRPYGAEDPMLWVGRDGVIHAILHDEQGPARCTAIGRHAFSSDGGLTWQYALEDAYNGTVAWSDGGGVNLFRRERPHMILSSGNEPLAVSNGVQEGTGSDRSWTLIQPIAQQPYASVGENGLADIFV